VRQVLLASTFAVACGFAVLTAPGAHAASFVNAPVGTTNTGPCLDVRGANISSGTGIVQTYTCNATFAQQWNFDVFTIQGLGSTASGNKCLDVFARGTADGTPVDITSCNGTPAQTWVYSGGRVINTNSNKCLTAGPLGTQVTIRTYNGTASQLWLVRS
jgi:hypothetical protein